VAGQHKLDNDTDSSLRNLRHRLRSSRMNESARLLLIGADRMLGMFR
jgi:hypothetical protein